GATILKAHVGRYYSELSAGDFRPAVPSITPAFAFNVDANGDRVDFVQTSSNTNLSVDSNLKAPYTDQLMAQIEQQLTPGIGLQVSYAHQRGHDYAGWADTAGVYVLVPYVDDEGLGATGETVMVYRLLSDPADRQFLLTTPGGLYSRYNG